MKSIKRVIGAQLVNMGGIYLDQALPLPGIDQIDPFLLIHHWQDRLSGNKKQNEVGVGPHPHRGFSPVTFIFKGSVHHRDSRGNNAVVGAGGTQWMDSGMGLVHSERPSKELAEQGGEFEIIQFWVNSPAKHKMDAPKYVPLTLEDTQTIVSADGLASTGVVAGDYQGKQGAIATLTPMLLLRFDLKKGGKVAVPYPETYNGLLYQLDGKLTVNGSKETKAKDMTWFNNEAGEFTLEALEDTRAILLAGEPIKEEVTSYGPFVMNNQTQIMQAMRDYQMGKMGVLVEEFE